MVAQNKQDSVRWALRVVVIGLAWLGGVWSAREAAAQPGCPSFNFQRIASTEDTPPLGDLDAWDGFANGPAVSATHAAFVAFEEDDLLLGLPGISAIYLHDGAMNSLVADRFSPVPDLEQQYEYTGFDEDLSIEGSTVGFEGFIRSIEKSLLQLGLYDEVVVTAAGGTFTNRGDTVNTTVPPANSEVFLFVDEPSLRGGNVHFRGGTIHTSRAPEDQGVFRGAGGSLANLFNVDSPVPGLPSYHFSGFSSAVASDGTTTAVVGDIEETCVDCLGRSGRILVTENQGTLSGVANTIDTIMPGSSNIVFGHIGPPAVHNGNVAFYGSIASYTTRSNVAGIYTTLGGTLREVASLYDMVPGLDDARFIGFGVDDIAIFGDRIVFVGYFSTFPRLGDSVVGAGIYMEVGGILCKVIDSTEMLDGRPIRDFDLQRNEAIHGSRIGFQVFFDNPKLRALGTVPSGGQALYIATTIEGACCLPDGTCITTNESGCLEEGGTYSGDGTSCAEVDCCVVGRAGYHSKADLFVWPKVTVRWNDNGTPGNPADDVLQEDTFISLVNDDTAGHKMYFYFVDGKTWKNADRTLNLTGNQSRYFSAYSGRGGGTVIPSFRQLKPEGHDNSGPGGGAIGCPGAAGDRVVQGFIIGWTVDENNIPICTNHIAASATLVNYQHENAWEYKPWAFRCCVQDRGMGTLFGGPIDETGIHRLNGGEYQSCPSHLLLDFWATGGSGFLSGTSTDFDITLVNMAIDLRDLPDHDMDGVPGELPNPSNMLAAQDSEPPTGAVSILTWNESESQVSNTIRCVDCWDMQLASRYGFGGGASPFALTTLQTSKGKGRLHARRDARCDRPASSPHAQPLMYAKTSKNLPILGVAHKWITFSGSYCANGRVAEANSALTGMGERTDGYIAFDISDQGTPPTLGSGSPMAATEVSDQAGSPRPASRR